MAAYAFRTITADQALAYDAATDSLSINTSGQLGFLITVTFQGGRILVKDLEGKTVTFGSGLGGEHISFDLGGGELWIGGYGNDSFTGAAGLEIIRAGPGNDTLRGGGGGDILDGGAGGAEGGQLVLVDVQLSSLAPGWIFGA